MPTPAEVFDELMNGLSEAFGGELDADEDPEEADKNAEAMAAVLAHRAQAALGEG